MVPDIAPMLAGGRGLPSAGLDRWSVEPKLDGWRLRIQVDPALPGGVAARTRRGHLLTTPIPGLAALAERGLRVVLDGEVVAGAGRSSDFYALAGGLRARQPSVAVSAWCFDLLWCDGESLCGLPYAERRDRLEDLPLPPEVNVVPRYPGADATAVLAACVDLDMEGIVLKRATSRYRPGQRSGEWRKVKVPDWSSTHGERRRST